MKSREIVIEATKVKTRFGEIPGKALTADIAVTNRGNVEAYIVSPERYQAFTQNMGVNQSELERLSADYDRMVAGMQSPEHESAAAGLMATSEADLRMRLQAHYAEHPVPKMAPSPLAAVGSAKPKPSRSAPKVLRYKTASKVHRTKASARGVSVKKTTVKKVAAKAKAK